MNCYTLWKDARGLCQSLLLWLMSVDIVTITDKERHNNLTSKCITHIDPVELRSWAHQGRDHRKGRRKGGGGLGSFTSTCPLLFCLAIVGLPLIVSTICHSYLTLIKSNNVWHIARLFKGQYLYRLSRSIVGPESRFQCRLVYFSRYMPGYRNLVQRHRRIFCAEPLQVVPQPQV